MSKSQQILRSVAMTDLIATKPASPRRDRQRSCALYDTFITASEMRAASIPPTPLNDLAKACRKANDHWWRSAKTGRKIKRNVGELICLMHSELSEAMEGERKDLMDDHLPHRRMAEVEFADVLIRIFDYCGEKGYDLDGAVAEKRAYNAKRADHKPTARLQKNGKRW